jgi:hypothetical protein
MLLVNVYNRSIFLYAKKKKQNISILKLFANRKYSTNQPVLSVDNYSILLRKEIDYLN